MKQRKHNLNHKRQFGQYMTPLHLSQQIVSELDLTNCYNILEPSCGDGSFLFALAERICGSPLPQTIELVGIEFDQNLSKKAESVVKNRNYLSSKIIHGDFFKEYLSALPPNSTEDRGEKNHLRLESFDLIVGNPPFGGSFDSSLEDKLDAQLGKRLGRKIKKETYSFFMVACLDLLRLEGKFVFICSDTLLTIPTMTGLRNLLMQFGDVNLHKLDTFSDETDYPMVVLEFTKLGRPGTVTVNSKILNSQVIHSTKNLSWNIPAGNLAQVFSGPTLGDYFIAISGMTTGKNELFIRPVSEQNTIQETHEFNFYDAPITLEYELERARLKKLSSRKARELQEAEKNNKTEKRVQITKRKTPLLVNLPNPFYCPYNKANNRIVFSPPKHYIYWKDKGEAVITYKKTGNWYLRGVGGKSYFGKEGITWSLVSSKFRIKYLPEGYILDAGAPCAFPRDGVNRDELFFILGWLLSDLANLVLKTTINHTMNIQSKDFERMPYPWWVPVDTKLSTIKLVKSMVEDARKRGKIWKQGDKQLNQLTKSFVFPNSTPAPP